MRFHLGAIPDDFTPDDAWRPIREPGPWLMQLCAIPIGCFVMLVVLAAWRRVPGGLSQSWSGGIEGAVALVLSFPLIIIVHEVIHALLHPRKAASSSSLIGFWPSRILFYAHYGGPLTRERFLAVFLAPFLVLSVLPLLIGLMGGLPSANVRFWFAWVSSWNVLFSCGDLFGVGLIFFQVPRRALVRNKGWRSLWRTPGPED